MSYTHLGEAHLTYQPDMQPVVDPAGTPGQLLGSGTGRIDGPRLQGSLRWSFFEEDCAWNPGILEMPTQHEKTGASACRTYPRGVIETDDGAILQFEGQGFAIRQENNPVWQVGSTVRFVTDADQYEWLTHTLAAYHGTFNEQTGTATWSFHLPER